MIRMLVIHAPLMADKITNVLSEYRDGSARFSFISKTGMKLKFDCDGIEEQQAAELAKKLIKAQPFGKTLYFSVSVE